MSNISVYVTEKEAIKSQTAIRKGIDNSPTPEHLANMRHVASNIFDKVREHLGKPLGLSSFYRSAGLNKEIGGATSSQHMKGEAIDIDCDIYGNGTNKEVFEYIKDNLEFDQLIGEGQKEDGDFEWVHVSLKRIGKNRKQVLLAKFKDGKASYESYE